MSAFDPAVSSRERAFDVQAHRLVERREPIAIGRLGDAGRRNAERALDVEAAAFAQAIPDFKKAGATVVGLTMGNVEQLSDFSSKHCAGQFPVAVADNTIKTEYDVDLKKPDGTSTGYTDRTTYVIGSNGKIVMAYTSQKPNEHITNSLAAVKALRGKKG